MSEGLKDTGSSKEMEERSDKEGIRDKDFYNSLHEALNLRNREKAEKTKKIFKTMPGIKIRTIRRQEETEELSKEKETTAEEETEKIKIVPIGKNDETNNLSKELANITKTGNKFKPKRQIRIKDYVDNVVDSYKRSVKNNRSELKQLRIGKGYISNDSSDFLKVYKHRAKYDYIGIIYRITEILSDRTSGRLIYGYSTESLEARWFHYKIYATNDNKKNRSIHNVIKNVIDSGRNPDQYFKREVIEIHFDEFLMRKREDYWIKKDKTQDPNRGFNTFSGGGGGKKMFLPTFSLSRLIAKGHTATDISKIFNKSRKYVTPKVVKKRIKENWGSMHNARLKFLKPVLKRIVNDGYSSDDIVRAFGIHGRHIIDRRILELFNGISYTELRQKCLKERLEPLIICGLNIKVMTEKLKWFGKKEIETSLKREWNGLNEARKQLLRPIIIDKLRSGQKIDDVLPLFGYSKSSIKKHKWRIVKYLFWGMTPQQVEQL